MSKFWENSSKDLPKKLTNYNESSLLKLNCDKALKELSWQPTLTFDETAKFTVEWYLFYSKNNIKDIASFTEKQIIQYEKLFFQRNKDL